MHSCPECGQACYCHGDIDDCEIESEAEFCVHDCDIEEGMGWDGDLED